MSVIVFHENHTATLRSETLAPDMVHVPFTATSAILHLQKYKKMWNKMLNCKKLAEKYGRGYDSY